MTNSYHNVWLIINLIILNKQQKQADGPQRGGEATPIHGLDHRPLTLIDV
jgi:hypothetical protein